MAVNNPPTVLDKFFRLLFALNGTDQVQRRRVNLIPGSGMTVTMADNPTSESLDVTLTSTGGGGGGITQLTGDVHAGPGTGSQASTVVSIAGLGVVSGFDFVFSSLHSHEMRMPSNTGFALDLSIAGSDTIAVSGGIDGGGLYLTAGTGGGISGIGGVAGVEAGKGSAGTAAGVAGGFGGRTVIQGGVGGDGSSFGSGAASGTGGDVYLLGGDPGVDRGHGVGGIGNIYMGTSGGVVTVAYVPTIPGNWSPAPTEVWGALDQLAARPSGGGGGGVSSVTASAPLASSGGATPNITLASAVAISLGGSGQTTQQAAIDALTGTQSSGKVLRSDGTHATLSAIQAADVPTLNQNTTGTSSNITGTVAIANGGTGQTTATAATNALLPSQTANSGKFLTTDGTNTSWGTPAGGGGGGGGGAPPTATMLLTNVAGNGAFPNTAPTNWSASFTPSASGIVDIFWSATPGGDTTHDFSLVLKIGGVEVARATAFNNSIGNNGVSFPTVPFRTTLSIAAHTIEIAVDGQGANAFANTDSFASLEVHEYPSSTTAASGKQAKLAAPLTVTSTEATVATVTFTIATANDALYYAFAMSGLTGDGAAPATVLARVYLDGALLSDNFGGSQSWEATGRLLNIAFSGMSGALSAGNHTVAVKALTDGAAATLVLDPTGTVIGGLTYPTGARLTVQEVTPA